MSYVVAIEGLNVAQDIAALPQNITAAARAAINKTADHARTAGARAIREQVNFPASYLAPSGGRLSVTKYASGEDLQAVITGRARPTSLAQFVVGNPTPFGKGGVSVQVKPGATQILPKAFVIKLRAGAESIDTKFNLGLAIRLRPGETIHNKRIMIQKMKDGLYLLYGPAVSQVFRTVSSDIAPAESAYLEAEFLRLLNLGGRPN
jgi:hypothetical protein